MSNPFEGEACVQLKNALLDAESFLNELASLDDQITDFVNDFGRRCNILSSVDTLLDEIDEFRKPFEDAMTKVTEVAGEFRTQVNNVLETIEYVYDSGVQALRDAMLPITSAINEAFTKLNSALDYIENAILSAADIVNSVACEVLNGAIQGLPPAIIAGSVAIAAKKGIIDEIADKTDARAVAKAALDKYAIRDKLDELQSYMNPLDNIPDLPNLQEYICDPLEVLNP